MTDLAVLVVGDGILASGLAQGLGERLAPRRVVFCETLSPDAVPDDIACLVLAGRTMDANWQSLLAAPCLRMVVFVNCEHQTVQVYCGYALPAADLDSLAGLIARWLVEHRTQSL